MSWWLSRWALALGVCLAVCPAPVVAFGARIAPRIGVNAATIDFDAGSRLLQFVDPLQGTIPLDSVARFGIAAGIGIRMDLGHHTSLDASVVVSQQGGALRGDELLQVVDAPNAAVRTIVESNFDITYLNVPLVARLGRPWADGQVYVGAGPECGVRVRSRVTQQIQAAAGNIVFDPLPEPALARTTVSAVFVAGFDYPMARMHGFVEFAFTHGLTPTLLASATAKEGRQRVANVSTGVRF